MVHMRRPRTVEGYKACSVHRAHKDVLRDEIAFAPSEQLFSSLETVQCRVPALAHMHEPVPVRVVAVLEPLVDEDVSRVVIERFADEFAHGDARGVYWGVKTIFFGGHCQGMGLCRKGVECRDQAKCVQPNDKSPDLNASRVQSCVPDKIAAPPAPSHTTLSSFTETYLLRIGRFYVLADGKVSQRHVTQTI